MFELSNLDENHKLLSNKKKKVFGKFKIETSKNVWLHEFIALTSKCYPFKWGDDSKNNMKDFFF